MASDDVIELGSSDEETEPAPKKRKPPLNTLVKIPKTLSGVSITRTSSHKSKSGVKLNPASGLKIESGPRLNPASGLKIESGPRLNPASGLKIESGHKLNPASIVTGTLGKNVTVTKVSKTSVRNPYANKKVNGNPVKAQPIGKKIGHIYGIPIINPTDTMHLLNSPIMPKTSINPINKVGFKTYSNNVKPNIIKTSGVNPLNLVKNMKPNPSLPLKLKKVTSLSLLPPGITIKKATTSNFKSCGSRNTTGHTNKSGIIKNNEVLTVDLDDDEPATIASASGHQWYLRPEDQEKEDISAKLIDKSSDPQEDESLNDETAVTKDQNTLPGESLEKLNTNSDEVTTLSPAAEKIPVTDKLPENSDLEIQNNTEPDKSTLIEITIEDSPIKPAENKSKKIGFKVGAELSIIIEDSPIKVTNEKTAPNCDSDEEQVVPATKTPNSKKKLEYPKDDEMVEIELQPMPAKKSATKEEEEKVKSKKVFDCEIVEIEESPIKSAETVQAITPKKNKQDKPEIKRTETIIIDDKEKEDFHPIYHSFIQLCLQLENSDDMKKIVEKKIKSYYRQVPKEYTESETFIDMVSSKITAIRAGPEKMYLYIKDIVDELNLQRKLAKAQPSIKESKNEEQEKFLYGEESEFDSKRQRQIRKLEKTLKKLHRAIQKLEEQEVDFDDEEDSVYLLTDRYKERMVRVHAKLCQLTNTKMPSEARVQIESQPGRPKGPAKKLEKWINRKVPIGTPLPFPDFHDVLRCVRDANQEDRLGWNEADIMEEARDLFMRCGKKLQRRRQENEWRLAASRIPADVKDPAEDSSELKKKLEENKRVATKKETEVLNKYADRQNLLQLEAVEIGDKEAEESPVESDDEPAEDNVSLISKEKRKERLKRLIQEKSKKVSDEKENQPEERLTEENSLRENIAKSDSNEAVHTKNTEEGGIIEDKDNDEVKTNVSKPGLAKKMSRNSDLIEKDFKGSADDSRFKNKDSQHSDKVLSLSDDSSKLESDIDELHLLQKLYSENEMNTSIRDSSDSGTPIAISDTSINDVSSNEERSGKNRSSDVISIENSSYSESEEKKGNTSNESSISKSVFPKETADSTNEIEDSNDNVGNTNIGKKNEKYDQALEDVLLASSDEFGDPEANKDNCNHAKDNNDKEKNCKPKLDADRRTKSHIADNETCINLKDDSISIGETVIEESRRGDIYLGEKCKIHSSDKNSNTDSSSVEGMEIGPEIASEEQNGEGNIIDTTSVKSDDGSITEITSVKSTEPNDDGINADTTSIKSVETIEDSNIMISETTSIKSVETVEDGNGPTSVKSVETIEDETTNVNSGDLFRNITEPMDTTENKNAGVAIDVEKNNDDSIPKPMVVDNVELT